MSAVVMFSGGVGSWAAARRWADEHGNDDMLLLFTDVGPGENEHLGEDPDTYRFLHDAADDIGAPLVILRDGRSIYDVFREKRWLGNASLSHCSWELKTGPARAWVDANCDVRTTVVVGIDWTEMHRLPKIRAAWEPYEVAAPMIHRPYLAKPQMLADLKARGIKPPRMYELGFAHANCRGCVKAGQGHWSRLLEVFPETFAYHEAAEQEMRDLLGDVSILRDRTGGDTRTLTLRELRERVEAGDDQLDLFDIGGCGCFAEVAS